jgi:hypothetical protein
MWYLLQANIFGVGGGVLSFWFWDEIQTLGEISKCMWRAFYISEVNITPKKGEGSYVWLVRVG